MTQISQVKFEKQLLNAREKQKRLKKVNYYTNQNELL